MDRHRDRELSQNIRREMSSPMTVRFARSLPFFRASDVLPTHLLDLLQRLEEQEGAHAPGMSGAGRH